MHSLTRHVYAPPVRQGVWGAVFYTVDLYCLLFGGRLLLDG